MKWAGYVAHIVEEKKCTKFWWGSPKEGDHLEEQGADVRKGSQ
jgi:hypothetical protein